MLKSALQLNYGYWCVLCSSRHQGGGETNGQVVSIKKAADGKRLRRHGIFDEKRGKNGAKSRV